MILPKVAILKLPLSNEKTVVETNYINYYLIDFNLSADSLFNFDDRQKNIAAGKWRENRQPFEFYFFVFILKIPIKLKK